MPSKIEWTDESWNPVVGCSKVSAGCLNCYAERQSKRFRPGVPFDVLTLYPDRLSLPSQWKRPRRIFVGSVTDLFHPGISRAYLDSVFGEIAMNPRHTFQILTKRIANAVDYLSRPGRPDWPLPNVWIGASVESAETAFRLQVLRAVPAVVRFVSFEPLLGPIPETTIQPWLNWVIVGGESGPNARPMEVAWALGIRRAARLNGIPFFMKQMGGWPKKRDGLADFPIGLRVREWPDPTREKP